MTPNELILTFAGYYLCANIGENRSRNVSVRVLCGRRLKLIEAVTQYCDDEVNRLTRNGKFMPKKQNSDYAVADDSQCNMYVSRKNARYTAI